MADNRLSLQEAAELLGVHYMTVYRYVRLGLLPAVKEGPYWRVAVADATSLRRDGPTALGRAGGRRRRAPWAERFDRRLRAGDEVGAWGVVESALSSGMDVADLYLTVIAPALRAIGSAWAAGEIDVLVEHRASVIAGRFLGRLGPRFARRGRSRGAVVLGTPAGELHSLPVTMLADLLRAAGFVAVDLGANLPPSSLVAAVREATPVVAVGLSATSPGNEAALEAAVAALHAELAGVPVLVGGGAVVDEAGARAVGADGWAADGRGAVELVERLLPAAAGRAE